MNGFFTFAFPVDVPFRWVSFGRVDIFERDGEVDEVKIEIVDAVVLELPASKSVNMLFLFGSESEKAVTDAEKNKGFSLPTLWNVFQSLLVIQRSSRFTRPSLMARLIP
jgi:hypothetical protein